MSNRMSRRSFLSGMTALGGSALLAACAPKVQEVDKSAEQPETKQEEAPTPAPKEEVTVKFVSWWGLYNSTVFPSVVEDLKDVAPHITVELQEIPYSEEYYTTCFAAQTCGDIEYHFNHFSLYYDEGLIKELTPYYEGDGIDFYDDFYHGLALCLWKGKIYGVPHMFETCLMMYNKDLVEEYYGQDLWEAFPDGNWEMEDMIEVSKACTQDTDGDGVVDQWGLYIYHRHYYYGMETQSWTRRDGIFDIDNVQFNFTGDGARGAAHFLLDAVRSPDAFCIGEEDASEINNATNLSWPMMAGKVAMRIRMSPDVGNLLSNVGPGDETGKFRWDLFYLPNWQGQQAITRAGGHPTTITTASKHPDDAWIVCREMGTSLGQKYIAETKISIPCYRKDPSLRAALEVGNPEHLEVLLGVVENKGGYGDHMRFHNENEPRRMFQNEMDLLYTEPYEQAKARLDDALTKLEADMNEVVDYGGGEKPYAGLPFPFTPGQVL